MRDVLGSGGRCLLLLADRGLTLGYRLLPRLVTGLGLGLASVEADVEIREDKLERREAELADLEEKLANKESELATYVQQIQSQLKDRESTWWNKVTGDGDPDSEEAA